MGCKIRLSTDKLSFTFLSLLFVFEFTKKFLDKADMHFFYFAISLCRSDESDDGKAINSHNWHLSKWNKRYNSN